MLTPVHIQTLQCSNRTVPADTISDDDDDTVLWDKDGKVWIICLHVTLGEKFYLDNR